MTLSNTLRWLAVSLSVRSRMNSHTLRSMSKLHSMICTQQAGHNSRTVTDAWGQNLGVQEHLKFRGQSL
jgi:hypothetical protein